MIGAIERKALDSKYVAAVEENMGEIVWESEGE